MKFDDNGTEVEIIKPKSKKKKATENNTKSFFNNNKNFISPIIMGLIGIVFLTNSNNVIIYAFYIIGALIIGFGIYNVLGYAQLKKQLKIEDNSKLMVGCLMIAIGLSIVILASFIQVFINLVIGVWLIYNGITKLISINNFNEKDRNLKLVESIVYIALGLYSILFQNIILVILGIWMIIAAIIDIYELLKK